MSNLFFFAAARTYRPRKRCRSAKRRGAKKWDYASYVGRSFCANPLFYLTAMNGQVDRPKVLIQNTKRGSRVRNAMTINRTSSLR